MTETLPSLFSILLAENPEWDFSELADRSFQILLQNACAEVFVKKNENLSGISEPTADLVEWYRLFE